MGGGDGNPPKGRLDGLLCRSRTAPWLGVRDWQLLIFRLGELEALGSSEPLGLAVKFSGCEVSWSREKAGCDVQPLAHPCARGQWVLWGCRGTLGPYLHLEMARAAGSL